MSEQLQQYLSSCLPYYEDEVLSSFVNEMRTQFGDSVRTILFYGSSMRSRQYDNSMLDFYVVVDGYNQAYTNRWYRLANAILPPNVFYLQVELEDKIYRSKYAVISKSALMNQVSSRAFHPYFWARFCQPFAYVYISSSEEKDWIAQMQNVSLETFYQKTSCVLEMDLSSRQYWISGFEMTYSSELRAESSSRAGSIYEANLSYYDDVYRILTCEKPIKIAKSSACIFIWRLRILLGKFLSILRLAKATTTFVNGVDYIAWKIERHSGEKVEITDKLRKHPWIYSWPILIRLIRDKSIR